MIAHDDISEGIFLYIKVLSWILNFIFYNQN